MAFDSRGNTSGPFVMFTEAFIITRREIRDSFRDWRIVFPIIILTLIFPYVMNGSTQFALDFVKQYDAEIIPLRLVPFATMIVGFFPISFSLVIALETFVGEKERNSLEPLLAAPLSDASLYLGKLFAAMLPPLSASYLGVASYLAGLWLSIHYLPEPLVLVQILILTTIEAVVMVAGAVVISSHTTSVRAANLLASFIIIPMAFLLQAESILLFWGNYASLWWIMLGLIIICAILVRIGVQTFNREAILAREIDELNLRTIWAGFLREFLAGNAFSLRRIYRIELPRLLLENRLALAVTAFSVFGSFVAGFLLAFAYPIAPGWIGDLHVSADSFSAPQNSPVAGFLPALDTISIFLHNIQALSLAAGLSVFSFGVFALLLLFVPIAAIGYITNVVITVHANPLLFLLVFVFPHGIVELPAAVISTSFGIKLGASMMAQSTSHGVGENFIRSLAEFVKVFVFLVVPLLLIAAFLESNLTPRLVIYYFGR
jgi:uncharacterized membrane protein SpoIIM required for sporulation/ABC-type transport system involved in multi-copper enzyme maturation permease subunit